jgi:FlaA1/EpsC-like NDP-sugar epimerase
VGLRPGEKLYEELLTADESLTQTGLEKILIAQPETVSTETLETMLATLHRCVDESGDMMVCLHALLPTFHTPDEVNARAETERRVEKSPEAPEETR